MLTISTEELRSLSTLKDELTELLSRSDIELPLRPRADGGAGCGGCSGCSGCQGCDGQKVRPV